jgi:hypothetical protein
MTYYILFIYFSNFDFKKACKWLCKGLHHPSRNCKHTSLIKLVQKQLQLYFFNFLQALTHATPNVAEKIFQFLLCYSSTQASPSLLVFMQTTTNIITMVLETNGNRQNT